MATVSPLLAERGLAERDLWYYLTRPLGRTLERAVHGDLVDALQGDDWDEVWALMPRGHFKTHIGVGYCTWRIARNRDTRCFYLGAVAKKTIEIVNLGRAFLEREDIVRLWGPFKSGERWSREEIIVTGRTDDNREPSLSCMGTDCFSPGGHYDVGVFDDADDQNTANTTEGLAWTRRVYSLATPMLDEPGAKRIGLATIWDDDDISNHVAELHGLVETITVDGKTRRRFVDGKKSADGRRTLIYKPAVRADGTSLFESRFPPEKLAMIRSTMTARDYSCQYLLDPVSSEDADFKPDDLRWVTSVPEGVAWFIGMDCARSRSRDADSTGHTVVGIDREFTWTVAEARRDKLDAAAIQARIFQLDETYPNAAFAIEEDSFVAGWKPQFLAECGKRKHYPRITWIVAASRPKKELRILGLQGLARAGKLCLVRGRAEVLEDELIRFPRGRHDDVADALANILDIARKGKGKRTAEDRQGVNAKIGQTRGVPPWLDEGGDANTPYARVRGDRVPWKAA